MRKAAFSTLILITSSLLLSSDAQQNNSHAGEYPHPQFAERTTQLWARTYGTGSFDEMKGQSCLYATSDGGYIISGQTYSYSDSALHQPDIWHPDIWILKLDSPGNVEWQRVYGGDEMDECGDVIHQTNDGGYIFAGTTARRRSEGGWELLILKLSSNGAIGESCEIMGSSDAQVTETFVSPFVTNIPPIETDVTPHITDVVPEEFTATTNLLCRSQRASREYRRSSGRVTRPRP